MDASSAREQLAELGLLRDGSPDMLELAYAFGAGMVVIDGSIDPDELYYTARFGAELFEGFDAEVFEARCRAEPHPPTVTRLAPLAGALLDERDRTRLFDLILAVSQADGKVVPVEARLLRDVARDLGIEMYGG